MSAIGSAINVYKHAKETRRKFLSCEAGVLKVPSPMIYLVGLGSVGFAVGSIILSGLIISDLSGIFVCFFASYMIYQRTILSSLGSLRHQINFMRSQINHFMTENVYLTNNVNRLSSSISDMEQVEKELSKLSKGDDVDKLVRLISKKKVVDEQIKRNTEATIIQQLLTTVLRSDKDKDLHINQNELNELMLRLGAYPGFTFHEKRFLSVIGDTSKPVSISKIMQIIRNLKDPNISDKDRVFVIDSISSSKK